MNSVEIKIDPCDSFFGLFARCNFYQITKIRCGDSVQQLDFNILLDSFAVVYDFPYPDLEINIFEK